MIGELSRCARPLSCALLCVVLVLFGCSDDSDQAADQAAQAADSANSDQAATGAAGAAAEAAPSTSSTAGVGEGAAGATQASQDDPFCQALTVFGSACQSCHGKELAGGAPFPLLSYEDVLAPSLSDPSKTVAEMIAVRIHEETRPMPPLSQKPLSDDQLATLDAWLDAGTPAPTVECAALPSDPGPIVEGEPVWPDDCQERYEIRAHDGNGGPYIVPADTEETIDLSVPVPWAGDGGAVQALAIRPLTNNKRVVHHWILYAGNNDFITSWSPGKPMETFPEGVGVHMPTEGNFRLNMHYFNVGNPQQEPDASGLEVCITRDLRPSTATTYMFSGSATVPPGGRVENVSTCNVIASEPVHLITSSPHMHSYGVASKFEVVRADGSVEVLEDAPFNWEDQHVTPIDTVIQNGDRVRLTCIYENPTDQTITYGGSSEDEMCFNFSRYYPMGALVCFGGGFF
ncbi:MAG: hypothetical protein OEZ06_06700 [Myxococcales bacterium]|nr:hypothetical protein [Myxococcales bacterium]